MNYYELLIVLILIFDYVSDSVLIGNNEELVYFDNSTNNYNYILDVIRRHKRQNVDNNLVNCEFPSNPLHAKYNILGDSEGTYKPGDFVREFGILELHCNEGFTISPFQRNISICINKSWSPSPTTCIPTCPSLISTKTTTVNCTFDNKPLENCINPIMGTIALLSCNPMYEEPNIRRNPVRVCRENRWDPSTSNCYPICGVKHPEAITNILGGHNVTVGDYPWHIGIYNRITKEFLCGGSIIDANIILTAAHCLTDYDGKVQPAGNYMIAAGKYFSKYNESRDVFAQYSNVLTIHVPPRYTGRTNSFAQDIAVMILSVPFTLSEAVQPVCIELNEDPSNLHFLRDGPNGVVTGWGYTTEVGAPSTILKELIIPRIPFNKCFNEVPDSFRRYFTADKICGGYLNNGTSVCRGDSGGALVFRNLLDNRYFAKGIVSTSPATEVLTCDSNQYSLFTSVDKHIEFIRSLVALNQFRTSVEYFNNAYGNEHGEHGEHGEKTEVYCLLPPNPENGKYSPYNYTGEWHYIPGINLSPKSEFTLSCDTGYKAIGATQFVCGDDGQWLPDLGICTRQSDIRIFPEGEEYTINATQTFTLRCAGKNFVTWTPPNNLANYSKVLPEYSAITIQSSQTPNSEYTYGSVLTITNPSYLNVGYYYCHENTSDFNDLSKVSKIYLYVYDTEILAVFSNIELEVTAKQYSKAVLPCRPTSPDIKVKLEQIITDDQVPLDTKDDYRDIVTYDPKTGYSISELVPEETNLFNCIFTRGDIVEELSYITVTIEPITYPTIEPLLEKISDGSTMVGQKLMLKCTLKYDRQFDIDWHVPNKQGIQSGHIRISEVKKTNNKDEFFQDLEIEKSTFADQGEYTCIASSFLNVNITSKFVKID